MEQAAGDFLNSSSLLIQGMSLVVGALVVSVIWLVKTWRGDVKEARERELEYLRSVNEGRDRVATFIELNLAKQEEVSGVLSEVNRTLDKVANALQSTQRSQR